MRISKFGSVNKGVPTVSSMLDLIYEYTITPLFILEKFDLYVAINSRRNSGFI